MKLNWHDSLEWLYPDAINENVLKEKTPVLDVPRGGYASIVLTVTDVKPGAELSVASDNARCCFSQMIDVCVNRNTGENGFTVDDYHPLSKSIVRLAPYRVYDALKPLDGKLTASDQGTAVLFIQVPVPYNAKPGRVDVSVSVSDGKTAADKTFAFQIYNVKLPENGKKSVYLTNWMDFNHFERLAGDKFGSAACWKVIQQNAVLMKHARQNTFMAPPSLFFKYENGKYTLNESLLKKYIKLFTDTGLYWIEGGHIGSRAGGWNCTDFKVFGSGNSVRSIEGNRDIAQIGRALYQFIVKNKLQDRWIQHVTDEPIPENGDSYRIFAGLVHKYMPGIPLMDAMSDPEIAGAPDIWCPQIQTYQQKEKEFLAVREQGDHIWAYTCCMPGGPWLNRLLDNELTRPLLLGWGCAYNNIEGYLHWGWNFSQKREKNNADGSPAYQDQFEETSAPDSWGGSGATLPAGDTHIMYPGPKGEAWSSCRLESQREGMEDWELIRMLKAKDVKKADSIVKKVFRAFDDYTTAPAAIRKARKALLSALQK